MSLNLKIILILLIAFIFSRSENIYRQESQIDIYKIDKSNYPDMRIFFGTLINGIPFPVKNDSTINYSVQEEGYKCSIVAEHFLQK